MKKDSSALRTAVKALLNEKLPKAEEQSLKDEGFTLKNPTRKAALAIAVYRKAVSGDLSAIKELRSILAGETTEKQTGKAVLIIDDTGD